MEPKQWKKMKKQAKNEKKWQTLKKMKKNEKMKKKWVLNSLRAGKGFFVTGIFRLARHVQLLQFFDCTLFFQILHLHNNGKLRIVSWRRL